MRRFRVAIPLCLFTLGGGILAASGQSGSQEDVPYWPDVNPNVLLADKSGQPDTTFDKSAIPLFGDGTERSLPSVTDGDAPVSLALLIDTSGSAKSTIAATTTIITSIVQGLPSGSEVMAILFADGASIGLPFTSAPTVPLSFLNRVQGHGGTAFYDALIATEAYIGEHAKFARRSIVVLSDCEDNSSRHTLQDAVRSVQQPGTPTVYFVVRWDPQATRVEKDQTEKKVKSLASANGGLMILPDKKQEATSLGEHIASLIRSQ